MPNRKISLAHGNGGKLTHELIHELFLPAFQSSAEFDGAYLPLPLDQIASNRIAFSTDAHVVTPRFFKGGDIGKLAVFGTCNDVAAMGAKPLYLSATFIIEEGFSYSELKKIVDSMAQAALQAGVKIVTGDTKVVEKNAADGIYISTSGIGITHASAPTGLNQVKPGDCLLVSGPIGNHGLAISLSRNDIQLQTPIESDCAPIWPFVQQALELNTIHHGLKILRDPTRGGLATTLNEFCAGRMWGLDLFENKIPILDSVQATCDLLGLDPLYLACEGRVVCITSPEMATELLKKWNPLQTENGAAMIGCVSEKRAGKLTLKTLIGGERQLDMMSSDPLPRIC